MASVPSGGTRWIALNSAVKSFDNLDVRKAVLAGFDRNALRLTRGGDAVGPVAQGFIPPGLPGFEESGGEAGLDGIDFMAKSEGDAALARRYMRAAGEEGVPVTPDGRHAGKEKLLTIATNADPGLATAQVAQPELAKLGFELNFRKVPQDTLYTTFCGVPSAKVATCPNVAWFRDFTDPESLLEPTFDGRAIKPAGNVNWTQLEDPAIDAAMRKASLLAGAARTRAWTAINRQVVNGYPTTWDLSFTSLR